MDRTALLAVLLVAALPIAGAGTAPAQQAPAVDETGTVHDRLTLLALNGTSATGFANQSLDVATAVSAGREAAAARLEEYALDASLEGAGPAARSRLVRRSIADIERRVADLRADERALRAAHTNGSIDTRTFVRRLARLHVRASTLDARLEAVGERAASLEGVSYGDRIQSTRAVLVGYAGPVRERVAAAIRGAARPSSVFVSTTPDGLVVATIDGNRYLREAYRGDRRAEGAPEPLALDSAVDRAVSLYPYSASSFTGQFGGRVYLIDFSIPGGEAAAHLDGSTRDVFYEVRDHRLAAASESVTASANGTRLVVNRTHPGGPLRVATYDTAVGGPARATVHIGGRTVNTGDDGVAWVLAPERGRFTVTAVRPAGNVTVRVRPLQPRPVGG